MNFLPHGFESLKTEKPYWKMSQMKEGENRLRIVSRPIAGWIDWKDGKPIRYRPGQQPSKSVDSEKPMRAFWTMHVWDYAREGLYILEVTQSSIIKTLTALAHDQDWGDFTGYDLKIKKEGTGKETKYSVTPLPHKPLSESIVEAMNDTPIRLEALYDGGDPWKDLEPIQKAPSVFDGVKAREATLEELAELLKISVKVPSPEDLIPYLQHCKPRVPKPMDEVVEGWMTNPDPFLANYKKWRENKKVA